MKKQRIQFWLDPVLAQTLHLGNWILHALADHSGCESKNEARRQAVIKSLERRTGLACRLTWNGDDGLSQRYRATMTRSDRFGEHIVTSGSVIIYTTKED